MLYKLLPIADYLALREKVLDAMWAKNKFPEQRADEIISLFGVSAVIEYESEGPAKPEGVAENVA